MRIEYSKTIAEPQLFNGVITPQPVEYDDNRRGDVIRLRYDLGALESRLTDLLDIRIRALGMQSQRTASGRIWISAPTPCAVILQANRVNGHPLDDDHRVSPYWFTDSDFTQIGTRENRRFFGRKQIPIYQEKPGAISIFGKVTYEGFENLNPTPMLNVLAAEGYGSVVVPTSQELEDALVRAKKELASRRSASARQDSGGSDGVVAFAAGVLLGSFLD